MYYRTLQILIKTKNKNREGIIMKTKMKITILALLLVMLAGCALYGNEAQYGEGDWYFIAGSSEVAQIQQNKLVTTEQLWIFEQNKKAYKENEENGSLSIKNGDYKFVLANLQRHKRWNAKVYKIVRPPYEDRSLWCKDNFYYCQIIGLRLSALLEPNERKVKALPMGYYIVKWEEGGKVRRIDPLTLMPLHQVAIPESLVEGTGVNVSEIKNYSYIDERYAR